VPPDGVAQAGRAAATVGWAGGDRAQPGGVVAQEHTPGLAEVTVLVRPGWRVVAVAMRLDGAKGRWELAELQW
jgi:Family of unknown function (DUF6459)